LTGFAFPRVAAARHNFMRSVTMRICMRTAFITILIEAVFLAERFSAIFRQAVDNHATAGEISLVLLLASPEIFDLALAFAILMGVYQVLLRVREDRELLVMSSAGMGIYRLVGALLGLALLAQGASLFVSGALGPAAQYAQRSILFNAKYRTLREGSAVSQFYFFRDHVVFVEPKAKGTDARHLFIWERRAGMDRIITVNDATLDGPDNAGRLSLQMRDFLAYDFDAGTLDRSGVPRASAVTAIGASNVTQQLRFEDVLSFDRRGSAAGEWTLLELLGVLPPPSPLGYAEEKALGERAARSLLCLLAPLLASLAIAFTTRATQTFALPLACLVLLGLDALSSALISTVIPMGTNALLATLGFGSLTLLAGLAVGVVRSQRALVRPALARA